MTQRYKLTLEYDGASFVGWQRQKNGFAVQEAIEEAIKDFCGETVTVHGSGRTDAGVHALAQVAHFDIKKVLDSVNPSLEEYYFDMKKYKFRSRVLWHKKNVQVSVKTTLALKNTSFGKTKSG